MNNSGNISTVAKVSKYLFWISLTIFLLSLSYNAGFLNGSTSALSGSAGTETGNVPMPSPETPGDLNGYWVSIVSLAISVFTGLSNVVAPWLVEREKRKTAQVEAVNQKREIERLRLELTLEEKQKKTARRK